MARMVPAPMDLQHGPVPISPLSAHLHRPMRSLSIICQPAILIINSINSSSTDVSTSSYPFHGSFHRSSIPLQNCDLPDIASLHRLTGRMLACTSHLRFGLLIQGTLCMEVAIATLLEHDLAILSEEIGQLSSSATQRETDDPFLPR